MDNRLPAAGLSGLDQIRAIFAGETGYEGIVKTLDLRPVSAEEGFVVFEGSPTQAVYNPMGSVGPTGAGPMPDMGQLQVMSAIDRLRTDSPLEGGGFELPVPGRIYSAAMRSQVISRSSSRSAVWRGGGTTTMCSPTKRIPCT